MTVGDADMSLERFKQFFGRFSPLTIIPIGRPICGRFFAETASLRRLRSLFAGGSGPAEPAHLRSGPSPLNSPPNRPGPTGLRFGDPCGRAAVTAARPIFSAMDRHAAPISRREPIPSPASASRYDRPPARQAAAEPVRTCNASKEEWTWRRHTSRPSRRWTEAIDNLDRAYRSAYSMDDKNRLFSMRELLQEELDTVLAAGLSDFAIRLSGADAAVQGGVELSHAVAGCDQLPCQSHQGGGPGSPISLAKVVRLLA